MPRIARCGRTRLKKRASDTVACDFKPKGLKHDLERVFDTLVPTHQREARTSRKRRELDDATPSVVAPVRQTEAGKPRRSDEHMDQMEIGVLSCADMSDNPFELADNIAEEHRRANDARRPKHPMLWRPWEDG